MTRGTWYAARLSLTAALGGFLMGYDASVISGAIGPLTAEFKLDSIQSGFAVACLTLTATFAMMTSGPLSDRFGRRAMLRVAAIVFGLSAVASAFATDYYSLVAARMLGGLGVGAALIVAPLYIAELAPGHLRGRMVAFNQLNIVLGLFAAPLANYFIYQLGQDGVSNLAASGWRWMLGVEAVPALIYFFALFAVPESPRWLATRGDNDQALDILSRVTDRETAQADLDALHASLAEAAGKGKARILELLNPALRLVLVLGAGIAILQQITGINAIFFYATTIFELTGISTGDSLMQTVIVTAVNVIFTIIAILTIDRFGRRTLLLAGVTMVAAFLFLVSWGFASATYTLQAEHLDALPEAVERSAVAPLVGQTFESDVALRKALGGVLDAETMTAHGSDLVKMTIEANSTLILIGILGFVAGFAVSLGPVMWVLFSELFPGWIRGIAISFVGLINSAVSFLVQQVFPWELENLGNSMTFLIYGVFAVIGLLFVARLLPETKGRSLEELETLLVKS